MTSVRLHIHLIKKIVIYILCIYTMHGKLLYITGIPPANVQSWAPGSCI